MAHEIEGLLLVVASLMVGLLVLWWVVRRIVSATSVVGRVSVEALSTGGVSLLWPDATKSDAIAELSEAHTPVQRIFDAFASGGISALVEVTGRERATTAPWPKEDL